MEHCQTGRGPALGSPVNIVCVLVGEREREREREMRTRERDEKERDNSEQKTREISES